MRKKAIYISILVFVVLLFSSCGNTGTDKEDRKNKNVPVTLNFTTFYEEGAQADAYKKIIESYQAKNNNVKVNLTAGAVNYDENTKNSLSQGKGPDIIGLQRSRMIEYINQGHIRDISGIVGAAGFKDKYYGVSIGYGRYNNKYYGIGDMPNPTLWYYNLDLFKKAGVSEPKDLTELINACNKLKKFTQYPIIIGAKDPWAINTFFGIISAQAIDTNTLSKVFAANDKQGLLNLQGANSAVDIFNQLIKSGALNKNVVDYDYAASVDAFVKGKAAILPMGSWAAEKIEKLKPKGFNYKSFENPVLMAQNANSKYSATAVQVIAINSKSKYPKQSEEFLKYLFSEEAQKIFAEVNGISSLKSANSNVSSQSKAQLLKHLESTDENSTMYVDNIPNKAAEIISQRLQQLIEGKAKPSEVWNLIISEYIP